MTTTAWVEERYKNGNKRVVVHCDELLTDRAKFVLTLIEKWGLIAGMPDGEDSSGRAKLRLSTPEELVKRAIDVVELLFDELTYHAWVIKGPSAAELRDDTDG